MHFFLQIHAHSPVRTNHLVCANSSVWRDVASRICKADILWIVANGMVRPLNRSRNELAQKFLVQVRTERLVMGLRGENSGSRQDHGKNCYPWSFIAVA